MLDYKFVVHTNCLPGDDEEFNHWYDEEHIPDLLAIPGFVGACPMRAVPTEGEPLSYRYLAIYDIKSDNVGAVLDNMFSLVGTESMGISPTLDADAKTSLWEVVTPRRTS